jgi:CRISPR-associated protein Cmr2
MNENFWIRKIMGILHDPPNKAILLAENKEHENFVKNDLLKDILNIDCDKYKEDWDLVKRADHIASAEDRFAFPKGTESNFKKRPILIHPLNGHNDTNHNYNLGSLQNLPDDKSNIVKEVVSEIYNKHQNEENKYQKIFLELWRSLNEKLKEKDSEFGVLWDFMPAETRMPNHSIWHHNRMVSAFAGALPEPALILMTIGPVQDFIKIARTTADYWAGSYILSYLSWEGMKVFADELGPDSIVFPDLKGQPLVNEWLKVLKFDISINKKDLSRPSLPNRWLVVCPKEKAEDLAKKAEENIRKKLDEIIKNCGKILGLENEFNELKNQSNFLEVYWAVLNLPKESELNDFESNYSSNFELPENFKEFLENSKSIYKPNLGTYFSLFQSATEKIMGARKSIRVPVEKGKEEKGYKCTLCGIREVVHKKEIDVNNYKQLKEYWQGLTKDINEKAGFNTVKKNERLCSVCLTRRVINKKPNDLLQIDLETNFPSVVEIAVADFKYKLADESKKNSDLKNKIIDFLREIPNKFKTTSTLSRVERICNLNGLNDLAKLEGEFLFEELIDNNEEIEKDKKADIKKKLKLLLEEAKKNDIPKPTPYLGFLYFDGDKMGEWISGTHKEYTILKNLIHPDVVGVLENLNKPPFFEGDNKPVDLNDAKKDYKNILNITPPKTPATQSFISSTLLDFSLHIARYIAEQKHIGKLVYAGGDDVVIMAPLSQILEIAKDIREAFSKPAIIFDNNNRTGVSFEYDLINKNFKTKDSANNPFTKAKSVFFSMGEKASGSSGICIAHFHNSLTDSFANASKAEKYAKNKLERNAFGVSLLKRSGEHSLCGMKWEIMKDKGIKELINMLTNKELSPSFITQLYEEIDTLWAIQKKDENKNISEENILKEKDNIILDRVKYLAKRHISKKDKKDEKIELVKEYILKILKQSKVEDKNSCNDKKKDEWLENFKNILNMLSFIARNKKIDVKVEA